MTVYKNIAIKKYNRLFSFFLCFPFFANLHKQTLLFFLKCDICSWNVCQLDSDTKVKLFLNYILMLIFYDKNIDISLCNVSFILFFFSKTPMMSFTI